VGATDVAKFLVFLPFIKHNINPHRIFVVAHRTLRDSLARDDTHFIDEDTLIPGVTYDRVREWVTATNPQAARRTGWYFQQFLKMGACYIPSLGDHYLIWDSDLAPFRRLTFFDEEGKMLLALGTHQHPAYFNTLKALLPLKPEAQLSFVSEHLMVKTSIMKELVEKIGGEPKDIWIRNCVRAIRREDLPHSGFSEYETYGHYMAANYADSYRVRRLKYLRTGATYMREPRKWFLIACSCFFDIGAFERWTPSLADRLRGGIRNTAVRLVSFTGYRLRWARSRSE
jgi:hypothetical protein